MELVARLAPFVVVGVMLAGLNIWYVLHLHAAFFASNPPRSIAAFHVLGNPGGGATDGQALAHLLVARLKQIEKKMADAETALQEVTRAPLTPPGFAVVVDEGDRRLPASVFQPLELNAQVGGVEVGGLLSWAHRGFARGRVLQIAMHYLGDATYVGGNWDHDDDDSFWVETPASADEDVIVAIAYQLAFQQFLIRNPDAGALTADEFSELMASVTRFVEVNRRAALGRPTSDEYAVLLGSIDQLVDKTPHWVEFVLLAADVSRRAGNVPRAIELYSRVTGMEIDDRLIAHALEQLDALNFIRGGREGTGPGLETVSLELDGRRPSRAVQAIRTMVGVEGLDMPRTVRIGIVGLPPAADLAELLQAGRADVLGNAGPRESAELAEYVMTLVSTIQVIAPDATFVFSRRRSRLRPRHEQPP